MINLNRIGISIIFTNKSLFLILFHLQTIESHILGIDFVFYLLLHKNNFSVFWLTLVEINAI